MIGHPIKSNEVIQTYSRDKYNNGMNYIHFISRLRILTSNISYSKIN